MYNVFKNMNAILKEEKVNKYMWCLMSDDRLHPTEVQGQGVTLAANITNFIFKLSGE